MACGLQLLQQTLLVIPAMLLTVLPDFDDRTPHAARRSSRVIWQERYEGIAVVAYQRGKAIAGISGPWSNRYALTWWQFNPDGQFEIFDTLQDAMHAVELRAHGTSTRPAPSQRPAALLPQRPSFWGRIRSWFASSESAGAATVARMRQRYLNAEADLSGLNFNAQ
jgi:hypothetical protein